MARLERLIYLLGKEGRFWQHESYDHKVRNEISLRNINNYILRNPVKAGLVDDWNKWPHTFYKIFRWKHE